MSKKANALLIILLGLLSCTIGFHAGTARHTVAAEPNEQRLVLQAERDGTRKDIIKEGLEDIFPYGILYHGVTNVTVTLNGETMPLEAALQEGVLHPEDIFSMARADARKGLCQELLETHHSLTYFTYRYADYDLKLVYDVLKTPDGQEHLVCDLGIYAGKLSEGSFLRLYDTKTMEPLDLEDWGIALTASNITSTGLTLTCNQSNGQQIGQLNIFDCILSNESGFLPTQKSRPKYDIDIEMGDITQIQLDWTEVYGSLPSGNYALTLYVQDEYSETQLNPLIDKFHDWQPYVLRFSIP